MSETPETDAVYERVKCSDEDYDAFIDMTHFARQLERQRDEAVALLRVECSDHWEPNDDPCLCSKCTFLATLDRTEKPHDR
jgi:hypothetical protein